MNEMREIYSNLSHTNNYIYSQLNGVFQQWQSLAHLKERDIELLICEKSNVNKAEFNVFCFVYCRIQAYYIHCDITVMLFTYLLAVGL